MYAGTVKSAADTSPNAAGKMVTLEHATPLGVVRTRYLHLDSWAVKPGDQVDAGELIGLSGDTGANAPHLHADALAEKDGPAHLAYQKYVGTPAGGFVLHSSGMVKLPLEPLLDLESPGPALVKPRGDLWMLLLLGYLLFSHD
jgi:murein DD-endopeptidase MepM/ murein hydrolase activator NlpD